MGELSDVELRELWVRHRKEVRGAGAYEVRRCKMYLWDLMDWCGDVSVLNVTDVELARFVCLADRSGRIPSISLVRNRLSRLNGFYVWAMNSGYCSRNPVFALRGSDAFLGYLIDKHGEGVSREEVHVE